jgi:serine phosphatase RsbU (regulator of sigma subunit)
MDTIFFLGDSKDQIPVFLKRLGYSVLGVGAEQPIPDLVAETIPDIILIDARMAEQTVSLLDFFRAQENTRDIPIVCLSPESVEAIEQLEQFERVELLPPKSSVGVLASRIATLLRLRKNSGANNPHGSLAEMNLALRDYNARMKKDLEEAREIQRNLMQQKLPRDPRFQLAVSYHPLEDVGGDWYSVELNPDGTELQLHIADVSGHGLPAAFLASMAKLAMVAASGLEPDKLLEKMSAYLHPQLPSGRFITTGHALYKPDTGEVLWARAGHGPALIRRNATGRVEQLYGEGFPIGFVSGEPYELVRDQLHSGDLLIVYTDGLTEAQNRNMEQFSLERLCQVISDIPDGLSSGKMVEWIIDALAGFLDERMLKDDVTLLLLRRE